MNTILHYKGFKGQAVYDDEAHLYHGDVMGIKDVITFQAKRIEELEQAFKDSVDDYLAWCREKE